MLSEISRPNKKDCLFLSYLHADRGFHIVLATELSVLITWKLHGIYMQV